MKIGELKVSGSGWLCVKNFAGTWIPICKLGDEALEYLLTVASIGCSAVAVGTYPPES